MAVNHMVCRMCRKTVAEDALTYTRQVGGAATWERGTSRYVLNGNKLRLSTELATLHSYEEHLSCFQLTPHLDCCAPARLVPYHTSTEALFGRW
jgi:hypothetical protein